MAFTVTELLVKLGLSGVDKVKAGLASVRGDMKAVGESAASAGQQIESGLEGSLKNLMGTAVKATAAVAGIGVATLGIVGAQGVQASLAFTELSARLEAVTGSADKAARKLAYAQAVANPSNFTFKQLADATVTLEAFGINAERALPTVARLGMAFGAGNEQLQMLVRGMGDMSSGSMMQKDVMASFGLNQQMFKEKGIKFDGQGSLQSSATDTMTALEKIVTERYGSIFDKMGNTAGAKLASLQDGWEKFTRIIGDGILQVAAPSLEKLSTLLNGLTASGVMKDVIQSLVNGFGKLTGVLQGDGLTRAVASILSVIGNLPEAIGKVGTYLSTVFQTISENAVAMIDHISKRLGGGSVSVEGKPGGAVGKAGMGGPLGAIFDYLSGLGGQAGDKARGEGLKLKGLPAFPQLDLLSKQDEYFNRISQFMKPTSTEVPAASGTFLTRQMQTAAEETKNLTREVVKNTSKTADALSLRRQSVGGGSLASIGATPAELAGSGGGGSMRFGSGQSFDSVGGDIARIIEKAVDAKVRSVLARQSGSGAYPR